MNRREDDQILFEPIKKICVHVEELERRNCFAVCHDSPIFEPLYKSYWLLGMIDSLEGNHRQIEKLLVKILEYFKIMSVEEEKIMIKKTFSSSMRMLILLHYII